MPPSSNFAHARSSSSLSPGEKQDAKAGSQVQKSFKGHNSKKKERYAVFGTSSKRPSRSSDFPSAQKKRATACYGERIGRVGKRPLRGKVCKRLHETGSHKHFFGDRPRANNEGRERKNTVGKQCTSECFRSVESATRRRSTLLKKTFVSCLIKQNF